MEGLGLLYNGFVNSFTLVNLVACFIGALIGTIVGVLPGLGPTATMALMLPFTLPYGPTTGLIMMTGVWYGAMYGGSTTSILVNIPGEAASVVTCIDGYQMCKKGRAGAALALVAVGSFVAGTIGILGLQFFAPVAGKCRALLRSARIPVLYDPCVCPVIQSLRRGAAQRRVDDCLGTISQYRRHQSHGQLSPFYLWFGNADAGASISCPSPWVFLASLKS